MERRSRAACAAAVLAALSAVLTGCGSQQEGNPSIELSPVPSSSSGTPGPGGSSSAATPADSGSCFDVAEALGGLELLPLTDQDQDRDGDDNALARARDSAASARDGLPAVVQPAFDEVRSILDGAGDTLQPAEAAKLHRALDPAKSWLQSHCAAAPTG